MNPAVVPAKEEAIAIHKSRMGVFVPIGCTCGAQLRYEEKLEPGSRMGGADAIRTAWRMVHSGPGCRFEEPE